MKPRVYVLEHEFNLGVYKGTQNWEKRISYYSKEDRDKFISEYKRLSELYYIQNIKTYYAELEEVDMDKIVNAI